MTSRAAVLPLLLAVAGPALAAGPEPAPPISVAPGTTAAATAATRGGGTAWTSPLTEIAGTVAAVDRTRRAVIVTTATGPAELTFDRNTLVYQPGGATTVLSIQPGVALRAGLDPARVAYWVQIRPPAPAAAKAPAAPAPAASPAAAGASTAPAVVAPPPDR